MRILLKIILTSLLLVLIVAVGAEVVALRRSALPDPLQVAPPVVVRKAAGTSTAPKTVRPVPGRPPVRRKAGLVLNKKAPG